MKLQKFLTEQSNFILQLDYLTPHYLTAHSLCLLSQLSEGCSLTKLYCAYGINPENSSVRMPNERDLNLFIEPLSIGAKRQVAALALAQPRLILSDSKSAKVSFYESSEALIADKRTTMRLGRFLHQYLNFNDEKTHEAVQHLTALYDWQTKLKFIENDDLQGWEDAYLDSYVGSCMSNYNYGVRYHRTFACYCASAHGLPDNGLRLAYITKYGGDDPSQAVARAIVHEPTKTYVRVYGDSQLGHLLNAAGYMLSLIPWNEGMIHLYTWELDVGGYATPYVDACSYASHGRINGIDVLKPHLRGDYDIQNVSGSTDCSVSDDGAATVCTCSVCGSEHSPSERLLNGLFAYRVNSSDELESLDSVCEGCISDETVVEASYLGNDCYCLANDCIELYDGYHTYFVNTPSNRSYYDIVYSKSFQEYYFECECIYAITSEGYDWIPSDDVVKHAMTGENCYRADCTNIAPENQDKEIWFFDAEVKKDIRYSRTGCYIPDDPYDLFGDYHRHMNCYDLETILGLQDITVEQYNEAVAQFYVTRQANLEAHGLKVGDIVHLTAFKDKYHTSAPLDAHIVFIDSWGDFLTVSVIGAYEDDGETVKFSLGCPSKDLHYSEVVKGRAPITHDFKLHDLVTRRGDKEFERRIVYEVTGLAGGLICLMPYGVATDNVESYDPLFVRPDDLWHLPDEEQFKRDFKDVLTYPNGTLYTSHTPYSLWIRPKFYLEGGYVCSGSLRAPIYHVSELKPVPTLAQMPKSELEALPKGTLLYSCLTERGYVSCNGIEFAFYDGIRQFDGGNYIRVHTPQTYFMTRDCATSESQMQPPVHSISSHRGNWCVMGSIPEKLAEGTQVRYRDSRLELSEDVYTVESYKSDGLFVRIQSVKDGEIKSVKIVPVTSLVVVQIQN